MVDKVELEFFFDRLRHILNDVFVIFFGENYLANAGPVGSDDFFFDAAYL